MGWSPRATSAIQARHGLTKIRIRLAVLAGAVVGVAASAEADDPTSSDLPAQGVGDGL
jgi:hypothetical protein